MPPLSRRQLLSGSGAVAAASLGAGCAARKRDPAGAVTLDFYNYATPEFLAIYRERLIPAFERRHPGIRIRINSSLGDAGYDAKLLTLIAGKLAPDLFHVTQANFPFYAAKQILLPLDDLLKNDSEISEDAFYPQVIEGMRYGGRLVGLPTDFSTIVMMYNQDLFDRFGVPYPEDDWTWEDYLDRARALTRDVDGDRFTDIYGTMNPNSYNRWPAWVWMNGGELFTPDAARCLMDTPQAIEGLAFYVDLARKQHVAPTPAQSMGQDFTDFFISGMAAMIADSRFTYKRYLGKRRLRFKWDLAHMPRHKTRATNFIWGGNCILKSTRHPEEAWKFLRFLSGPDGAAITRAAGNGLPAYREAAEEEIRKPSFRDLPAGDYRFLEAVSYGRMAPYPPQYAEYTQIMTLLQDAFLGLKPVETACIEFTREVNALLKTEVF